MPTITLVKDRTTGSCTGMCLAALEVHATDGSRNYEYRIRESAYHAVWQLQELREGCAGMVDADYLDLGDFPSSDAALEYVRTLPGGATDRAV